MSSPDEERSTEWNNLPTEEMGHTFSRDGVTYQKSSSWCGDAAALEAGMYCFCPAGKTAALQSGTKGRCCGIGGAPGDCTDSLESSPTGSTLRTLYHVDLPDYTGFYSVKAKDAPPSPPAVATSPGQYILTLVATVVVVVAVLMMGSAFQPRSRHRHVTHHEHHGHGYHREYHHGALTPNSNPSNASLSPGLRRR